MAKVLYEMLLPQWLTALFALFPCFPVLVFWYFFLLPFSNHDLIKYMVFTWNLLINGRGVLLQAIFPGEGERATCPLIKGECGKGRKVRPEVICCRLDNSFDSFFPVTFVFWHTFFLTLYSFYTPVSASDFMQHAKRDDFYHRTLARAWEVGCSFLRVQLSILLCILQGFSRHISQIFYVNFTFCLFFKLPDLLSINREFAKTNEYRVMLIL